MNTQKMRFSSCVMLLMLSVLLLVAKSGNGVATTAPDCGSWRIVPSPNLTRCNSLAAVKVLSSSDIWAVGQAYKTPHSTTSQALTEHWDGTQWSIVASPDLHASRSLIAISAVSTSDIWAVGFTGTRTLIEHWNGSHWNIIHTPGEGTYARLSSVSALAANNIWAVGYTNTTGGYKTLVEHWNGSSWSIVPSPNRGSYNDMLVAISTASAKNIWAVGWYRDSSHALDTIPYMLHWNGTTWSVAKTPNPGSYLYFLVGLAQVPGTGKLWAVGYWQYHNYATVKTLTEFYC
ncbi:MAG: hypothetical protein ABI406_08635 [Ktedonobacteraceae bacterium]